MLWVGMGGHRLMHMVMVRAWVQIRREMLGSGLLGGGGHLGKLDVFNQPCGNLGACPWGERCQPACPLLFKLFTFERRQLSLRASNFRNVLLGLHKKFRPTQK